MNALKPIEQKNLIKVEFNQNEELCVSARKLHEFLEIRTQYKDWFPRMLEYGFTDGYRL